MYRREEKEFERNRAAILDNYGLDVHLQPMGNLASHAPAGSGGQPADANEATGAGDGDGVGVGVRDARESRDVEADAQQELQVVPNESAIGVSEQLLASTSTAPLEPNAFSITANVVSPTLTSVDVEISEISTNKTLCSTQVLNHICTTTHFSNVKYFASYA